MIYLDNAATTLQKPEAVIEAVCTAMRTFGNCGRSVHAGALNAGRAVFETRKKLARLFGCDQPERVCFTRNSTEALNLAVSGLFSPGDHVLSTDCEHNSVLRPLYRLEKQGVEVDFLPADRNGNLDYADFSRLLRGNTKAVVCTHASNLTGNLLSLEKIGAFCRENGLLLIVDASQTAGVFPIDMRKLGISVLCFTGHKGLLGPQGTGGLCVAEGVEIRPFIVGGTGVQTYLRSQPESYPTRLEAGTLNGHGLAGLSAALDYIEKTGPDTIRRHDQALAERFLSGVRQLPGVTLYGDFSAPERAPIVSLNLDGWDSSELADVLACDYDIAVRGGAHCAPRLHEALGTAERGAVRFSFGWFNTTQDTDAAVAALRELACP